MTAALAILAEQRSGPGRTPNGGPLNQSGRR